MSVRWIVAVRLVAVVLAVLAMLGLGAASQGEPEVHGGVAVLRAWAFDAGDAPLASGWFWLRPGSSQSADWLFGPINTSEVDEADSFVYINLNALVTNAENGGSGWETAVQLEIYLVSDASSLGQMEPAGRRIASYTSLRLQNHFLPQIEADTQGIGYTAQIDPVRIACSTIDRYAPEYGPLLLIRLTRKGATAGAPEHVAVNAGGLLVAYRWANP